MYDLSTYILVDRGLDKDISVEPTPEAPFTNID